ncbi:F0F1 ATP synthase subunit alpha, partial [bacterium]|nr:F0F1 ATP synthase subunit alpha [bacterium]
MAIRPEEIMSVIKKEMESFSSEPRMIDAGVVLQVGDGIARVYGLPKAMAGELVEFSTGVKGYILNLEEDNVGCILLGSDSGIKEGDLVKSTGKVVQVPVGEAMLGRVVNAIGEPVDGKGPIVTSEFRPIETPAPNVVQRQPVK